MLNKRVLVLASYPIVEPQHGGQKRVKALVGYYRKKFKYVKYIAIFHKASYPDKFNKTDIPLGQLSNLDLIDKRPYLTDMIIGASPDSDHHVRSQLAKALNDYKPHIIHVEQPYIYQGLEILIKELNMHPKIIYGTQTIEHAMKKEIYSSLALSNMHTEKAVEEIKELEMRFSKNADLVLVISNEEGEFYKKYGAKRVVIVPNGIDKIHPSKQGILYWEKFKKNHNVKRLIVFIGSGHPPNHTGFTQMVGLDSTFMPADSRILLVGGVSDFFKEEYTKRKLGAKDYEKFWSRIIPVGKVSEDHLGGLISLCDVLILPITYGGGSNLKTAEALLADKKVVATNYAFRGFENYKSLPNLFIGNHREEFKEAILNALHAKQIKRNKGEKALVRNVLWENCMSMLDNELIRICRPSVKSIVKHEVIKIKRRIGRLIQSGKTRLRLS